MAVQGRPRVKYILQSFRGVTRGHIIFFSFLCSRIRISYFYIFDIFSFFFFFFSFEQFHFCGLHGSAIPASWRTCKNATDVPSESCFVDKHHTNFEAYRFPATPEYLIAVLVVFSGRLPFENSRV